MPDNDKEDAMHKAANVKDFLQRPGVGGSLAGATTGLLLAGMRGKNDPSDLVTHGGLGLGTGLLGELAMRDLAKQTGEKGDPKLSLGAKALEHVVPPALTLAGLIGGGAAGVKGGGKLLDYDPDVNGPVRKWLRRAIQGSWGAIGAGVGSMGGHVAGQGIKALDDE